MNTYSFDEKRRNPNIDSVFLYFNPHRLNIQTMPDSLKSAVICYFACRGVRYFLLDRETLIRLHYYINPLFGRVEGEKPFKLDREYLYKQLKEKEVFNSKKSLDDMMDELRRY